MRLSIVIFSLVITIHCNEDREFTKLASADKEYIVKLERQQAEEIHCLKQLDRLLTSKWNMESEKIRIENLGEISGGNSSPPDESPSSNPLYDTMMEELMMTNGSLPSKRIDSCLRDMIKDMVPFFTARDVECLNKLFENHIVEERSIENEFIEFLNDSVRDQLPFKHFITFREFVEMMFQNRNPDALSALERGVYDHLESYVTREEDKDLNVFIILQECSWKHARALREAPNSKARYEEFVSQIRHSVNWRLGNMMLPVQDTGPLNLTLIVEKHEEWLQSRDAMKSRLTEEVERLKTQHRDAQWLCEYGAKLAYELFQEQSPILDSERLPELKLEILETATRLRNIEGILKERKDIRQESIHALRTSVDNVSICLASFSRIVQNHQRRAVATAFTDSTFLYQDIRCGRGQYRFIGINNGFCNCVGSFCVNHGLAVLNSDHYEIVKGTDGIYKIVPSNGLISVLKLEKETAIANSSETIKNQSWKDLLEPEQ